MASQWYTKGETHFVSDFETLTENTNYFDNHTDTRVILWSLINKDTQEKWTGTSMADWFETLKSFQTSITVYFHNLDFDGKFILPFLSRLPHFKLQTQREELLNKRSHNGYSLFTKGGKIYGIRIWYRDKKKVTRDIFIRCSLKLLNTGIGSLGDSLGMTKHEDDPYIKINWGGRDRIFYDFEPVKYVHEFFNVPRGREFVEYCIRDTEIQYKALNTFIQAINELPVVVRENERRKLVNQKIDELEKQGKKIPKSLMRKNPFNALKGNLTAAAVTTKVARLYTQEWIENSGINETRKKDDRFSVNSFWRVSPAVDKWIRPFYKGGFAQFNDKLTLGKWDLGKCLMMDITSAYPYQMVKHPMPYGSLYTEDEFEKLLDENPNWVENEHYYRFMMVKVKSAKIKPEYSEVPCMLNWEKTHKDTNRYIRNKKNFTCCYLSFEWELLNRYYDIEWLEMTERFMKADWWLRDAAKGFYDVKEHYAATGQDGLKQMAKILVNALYGVHGKAPQFDKYVAVSKKELEETYGIKDLKEDLGKEISLMDENGKEHNFKFKFNPDSSWLGDDIVYLKLEPLDDVKDCPNVAAAAVITAWERVYLLETLERIGFEHFIVSDTDSIAIGNLSITDYWKCLKIMKENKIEGSELGMWENDLKKKVVGGIFRYASVNAAKRYCFWDKDGNEIKFRCAGYRKYRDHHVAKPNEQYDLELRNVFDFDKEVNELDNASTKFNYYTSGVTIVNIPKTFRLGSI